MESGSTIKEENEVEEHVILISESGSIVIDENTTFVDDDGNPVIVHRKGEGENIEFIFQSETDATDTTEIKSSNDSQEHASSEQEESSTAQKQLLEVTMDFEVDENVEHSYMEQEDNETVSSDLLEATKKPEVATDRDEPFKFSKISKNSKATAISFLKRKKQTDETDAVCKSVIVIENNHVENVVKPIKVRKDIPEGTVIDNLTCPYCIKKFITEKKKMKHVSDVHKVVTRNPNSNNKCVECNLTFVNVRKLIDHLQVIHRLNMDEQELSFSNMNEFYKWKSTIERQELSRYLRSTVKTKEMFRYEYFVCHRSGKSRVKRRKGVRMPKRDGSLKLGLMCTSSIRIKEYPDVVKVTYCPHHYGHGKETNYRKLSAIEQSAIQETISNGVSCENILGDMHEDTANFGVAIIKSTDQKLLRKTFDAEDNIPGCLSDADSLNSWVRTCTEMEDSPILYYSQEENKILLIIMTEFQKNILMSSDKQILSIDNALRQRGSRFYLTSLMALDEHETAFPVAFCISSKVDKNMVTQFLMSIKDSTGPLFCSYFMSDSEVFYYEAWQEVMQNDSIWLWNKWYVDNTFLNKLHQAKLSIAVRSDLYKRLKSVSECRNIEVFETMFKNFTSDLCADQKLKNVAKLMLETYGCSKETWAYCYHKDLKLSSVRQLETLHRTMKYCCREGRKKRLDKFIFVLMKYVRFKMLDRLNCMLDEEKIALAVKAINAQHDAGFEIPTDRINSLGDKIWMISSENEEENVYVLREHDSCPEFCSLKCSECDTCVHMFSCSCVRNMIYADLCLHIHAVVWKFLTPHFSPLPSPVHDTFEDIEDSHVEESSAQNQPDLFDTALKMTHDAFKKIRSSKSTLKDSTLVEINNHLKAVMDICSGKVVQDSPLNCSNELNLGVANTSTKAFIIPYPIQSPLPMNPNTSITKTVPHNFIIPTSAQSKFFQSSNVANTTSKAFIISTTIGSTVLTNTNPMWANTPIKNFFVSNTVGSTKQSPNVMNTTPRTFFVSNPIRSPLPPNTKSSVLTPVHNSIMMPRLQMSTIPRLNLSNTAAKAFIIQNPIRSPLPTNPNSNGVQKNFVLANSIGSILPTNPTVANATSGTISTQKKVGTRVNKKRNVAKTLFDKKSNPIPLANKSLTKSD
ncbi:hypothetical protein JTE90_018351 [Oedothorax gibbosus]|uniref:C2H2-type domain-containing protein n=1 Tax=Oedothorax gibbosus TaxID=931172 RepID=A0AAV6TZA3_9ARAC|nr:hypothetical protein JTE90_018351 [Oedothorax gibbosus]